MDFLHFCNSAAQLQACHERVVTVEGGTLVLWYCKYPTSEDSEEYYSLLRGLSSERAETAEKAEKAGLSSGVEITRQDNWAPSPPAGDIHQPRPPLTAGRGGHQGEGEGPGGERRHDDAGQQEEAQLWLWL